MNNNRMDQNYLKNLKVLYVEDDDETRKQFCEFLNRPVGTLITAVNGAEGLEAFIRHSPDIVVTDILMPIMDGLTMAHEIRGYAPSVPIIVVTAFEQTDYLKRAIEVGIDKYVTKPVNSYLLFECLLDCAHRLRAEEQLKLGHQREIQEMWGKHYEIIAGLAGGLAHDYNNLLQAILGSVALAKTEIEPGSLSWEYLLTAEECFTQANALGSMLKLLSKNNEEYTQQGQLLPFIRHILESAVRKAALTLTFDYPEDSPQVRYSDAQLHLVFSRLAENAIEAMPSGGSLLLSAQTMAVTESSSLPLIPGIYLNISLKDTGTGISSEDLPHIFYPYFSTKQKGGQRGMGLSLALCHTIIIKHGGYISAESIAGCGTTFKIWLPVAQAISARE